MPELDDEHATILAALLNGTVIDHIPAGLGMSIVKLLKLEEAKVRFVIGCNLDSSRFGKKDVIKVYDRFLSDDEANQVAVFAPDATTSIVHKGEVERKFQVVMPDEIHGTLTCPNSCCITRMESHVSKFSVRQLRTNTVLTCHFCDTQFALDGSISPLLGES